MTDKNKALKDLEIAHKADTGAFLSEAKDSCHSFVADWYEVLKTALQPSEWQPIKTAPKDGTLFCATDGHQCNKTKFVKECIYWPSKGDPVYRGNFIYIHENRTYWAGEHNWTPTHWTPLPKPSQPEDDCVSQKTNDRTQHGLCPVGHTQKMEEEKCQ